MTVVEFMLAPFAACLLLIGINIYFGIHVIKREIIFIDIALAQIAAFGALISSIAHDFFEHPGSEHPGDEGGFFIYLFSIIFTTLAAAHFTYLKSKKLNVPLEALIGISYAVAATGTVIIMDTSAGSDVHVKEMLEGAILWVSWWDVLHLFGMCCIIGAFHYFYRHKFIPLTDNYSDSSHYSSLWDFLFYASFGVVVVYSVNVGGILTIFAFLIIPASISALFASSWQARIIIGWGIGTVVSICGLYVSWTADIASAPTVILFLGIFLVASIGTKTILKMLKYTQK